MGVGAGLDHVTLFNLLVEERGEAIPASPLGVDLSHGREYRKRGVSAIFEKGATRAGNRRGRRKHDGNSCNSPHKSAVC